MSLRRALLVISVLAMSGCRSPRLLPEHTSDAPQLHAATSAGENVPTASSRSEAPTDAGGGQAADRLQRPPADRHPPDVQLAAHRQEAAIRDPPTTANSSKIEPRATDAPEPLPLPAAAPLRLEDVVASVYASYPTLDAVSRERQIAAGKQLAAMGEFDINLLGETINQPLGYYKNYRHGLGVKQYSWSGAQTFGGYRLGRGFYEPWYKERQTDDGGEFKAGVAVPFLRDRSIDKRRAAVFQARIDRAAAEPQLQLEVIDAIRAASTTYWGWVAAGRQAKIAEQMLQLAAERQKGLQTRFERGDIAGIELVDNERLIVSRQGKLIEAELKLRQASIKLSLFLRDATGTPLLALPEQLPAELPAIGPLPESEETEQVADALARRPELRLITLDQQRQEVEVRQASNLVLPSLDGLVTGSQDVGDPASPKGDKSPFELEAGLQLEVPLQRREARGKMLSAQAKLAQLSAKRVYAVQSIAAEVQASRAAVAAHFAAVEQARRGAELAGQLADAERTKLDRGDSNILMVNLRESAAADAELLAIDAIANYFVAEANLHAALAAELSDAASLDRSASSGDAAR